MLVLAGDVDTTEEVWPFDMQGYKSEDEDFWISEGVLRRYARVRGRRLYFAESTIAYPPSRSRVDADRADGCTGGPVIRPRSRCYRNCSAVPDPSLVPTGFDAVDAGGRPGPAIRSRPAG